jgi:hypothetical protein
MASVIVDYISQPERHLNTVLDWMNATTHLRRVKMKALGLVVSAVVISLAVMTGAQMTRRRRQQSPRPRKRKNPLIN